MAISGISGANNFKGYMLSDEDAQRIALAKTMKKAEKRQKRHNLAYLSVPLVAGIATAALTKGNTKLLGAEISNRAAKLGAGLKSAGDWGLMLASILGIGVGERVIMNKSDSYKNFKINHPILSFIGDAALVLGTYMALPVLGSKLYSKLSPAVKTNVSNKVSDWAAKLNNFKAPKFLSNLGQKVSDYTPEFLKNFKNSVVKNTPDGLKDIGKSLLSLSPHILLFGTFFSSLATPAKMRLNYEQEYNRLKNL